MRTGRFHRCRLYRVWRNRNRSGKKKEIEKKSKHVYYVNTIRGTANRRQFRENPCVPRLKVTLLCTSSIRHSQTNKKRKKKYVAVYTPRDLRRFLHTARTGKGEKQSLFLVQDVTNVLRTYHTHLILNATEGEARESLKKRGKEKTSRFCEGTLRAA